MRSGTRMMMVEKTVKNKIREIQKEGRTRLSNNGM